MRNTLPKLCILTIFVVCGQIFSSDAAAQAAARASSRSPRNQQTTTVQPQPGPQVHEQPNPDANDPVHAKTMHPVTRLYMIQAKRRQVGPIFREIARRNYRNDKNHIIRQEFQLQVKIGDNEATEWGDTKRNAKRRAAIAILKKMGLQVDVAV